MTMSSNEDNNYPLNCIEDTGDGFSGWFAISNSRVCNDFCYWQIEVDSASPTSTPSPEEDDGGTNTTSSTMSEDAAYHFWNTANPHVQSVIYDTANNTNETGSSPVAVAYWTCLFNVANDKVTVSNAGDGQRWIDVWQNYATSQKTKRRTNIPRDNDQDMQSNGIEFPYLRCQKGASEQLTTWSSTAIKSVSFYQGWIVLIALIFSGEVVTILMWVVRKRRMASRYAQVGVMDGEDQEEDTLRVAVGIVGVGPGHTSSIQIEEESWRDDYHQEVQRQLLVATPRCKYCAPCVSGLRRPRLSPNYICRILLVLLFNLLLTITLSFVSISLMELHSNPHFTESMQVLTPACSDPSLVCPAANQDIDRPSTVYWSQNRARDSRRTEEATTSPSHQYHSDLMKPFSYIIASDAQLYWFNGEFSEMGKRTIPSSCAPSDSCGRCTSKHGLNTNLRLKKAWESLMMGATDGMKRRKNVTIDISGIDSDDLPVPSTLVMNGDLTAYFHPWEKRAYDNIYHNISGLKYYFPSLGNHDIEHPGGAMYGGDEWATVGGPPNCNMEHAIGYFKSGFCGEIPSFHPDRLLRYDSSSLAYSWEEGRYHFVHSHYYPSYEMASVNYHMSLEWLERDLQLANDAGLTSIIFVHAAQGLNKAMETILLGKNVRLIIAGHTHRCLVAKCEGLHPLNVHQIEYLDVLDFDVEKCFPAAYDTCQVLTGENMVYVKDLEYDISLHKKRLENRKQTDKRLCPKPAPLYINETDNTLLCRRIVYSRSTFPFDNDGKTGGETIPIYWSGSSSFETFLRGDFYDDRIVINAMTVSSDETEAVRYVDAHDVPNAVYPHHETSDFEEVIIYV